MLAEVARPVPRTRRAAGGRLAVAVPVFGVALAARLLPVLHGGGLFGLGNYDDGVYYAAAAGLARGLVPYRDFLLLHPPGIVLLLWPFAALGHLVGDAAAMATARVAFMVLGALDAVLVAALLRGRRPAAALVGGTFFALCYPATVIGHSTLLETPTTTCLLLAVLLVRHTRPGPRYAGAAALAGGLLGVSAATKIWGVALVVAVVAWVVAVRGVRHGLHALAGSALGASLVCLPFWVLAPAQMTRMVVSDQLARGGSDATLPVRASAVLGLTAVQPHVQGWSLLTLVGAALLGGCAVLALRSATGRLGLVLLATTLVVLAASPSWYVHYAGLSAAPLAVVVGAAAGTLLDRPGARVARALLLAAVLAALVGYGAPGVQQPWGNRFPAAALRPATAGVAGCVTSDDPGTLVELGVLQQDLTRRCPLVVDLTGYAYDLRPPGAGWVPRARNAAWQREALGYLGGGSRTLVVRLSRGFGLSRASAAVVARWPVLLSADGVAVRRPGPLSAGRS